MQKPILSGWESTFMRLLRVIQSRLLACGCLVGVYETYGGESLEIIDSRGQDCVEASHRPGVVVPAPLEPPRAA
jgi:hypothetical protein